MKLRTFILTIVALVSLDQIIKYIIQTHYLDTHFEIIPGLLEFLPKYNYAHSYVNQLFGVGMGFLPHIILFVAITVLLFFMYGYVRSIRNSKLNDFTFIFGISGAVSAILSISFWEGVLDYIYLVPLFVFDLKDLYMNVFVVLCVICGVIYQKEKISFSGKGFLNYIRGLFVCPAK